MILLLIIMYIYENDSGDSPNHYAPLPPYRGMHIEQNGAYPTRSAYIRALIGQTGLSMHRIWAAVQHHLSSQHCNTTQTMCQSLACLHSSDYCQQRRPAFWVAGRSALHPRTMPGAHSVTATTRSKTSRFSSSSKHFFSYKRYSRGVQWVVHIFIHKGWQTYRHMSWKIVDWIYVLYNKIIWNELNSLQRPC